MHSRNFVLTFTLFLLLGVFQTLSAQTVLEGVVYDAGDDMPVVGAAVFVKNTSKGTLTDTEGRFSLDVPSQGCIVCFSLIGYEDVEKKFDGSNQVAFSRIPLRVSANQLEGVVVTGVYERPKESFTGASASFRSDELKMMGTQSVLQSLTALDPSIKIMENSQFGSDPNRMPDFEIRGKSSVIGLKEEYGTDPNQPLFILDGFETTLETVMNLNMNRVASVTILKDAASTAIYGSKASNGVVVIETKAPSKGRLRFSYKGDYSITVPDLTDYNLMNSAEKLEFETLAGVYTDRLGSASNQIRLDNLRNERYKGIVEGVDTYWLSEPLRTGFTHKHNVYAEGGEGNIRYGIGLSGSGVQGVMKKSTRQSVGGNVDLIYRTEKFQFSNKLTIDNVNTENPVESFASFARANPYYRKYSEDGSAGKYLYYNEDSLTGETDAVPNPLYNWNLNNYDESRSFAFTNNFIAEWFVSDALRLRAKFGISHTDNAAEERISPLHSDFDDVPLNQKGSYSHSLTRTDNYEGDVTAIFGKVFDDLHTVNVVGGFNFNEMLSVLNRYKACGFTDDQFGAPSFANAYPEGGKPSYTRNQTRAASFYLNGGYSYDNRYLLDFNYRADGASMFGTNNRFRNTWSVGLGWNMHKEKWIGEDRFQMLKLRSSVGNPGNQNFAAYQAFSTYVFNGWMTNVFGPGVILNQLGNPDLAWQETINFDVGTDITTLDNRLTVVLDYYRKITDPLLAVITTPGSIGISSVAMNAGEQHTAGYEYTLKFSPVYRPYERINWTLSINGSHSRSFYAGIGDSFSSLNEEGKASLAGTTRYFDGGSPTAIWGVRSAGIDPATGKELFIKKDGSYSFEYDVEDEVVLGDTQPLMEGVFGTMLYYKGFSLGAYLRYSIGAQVFNSTLFQKVENISTYDVLNNQDRRALYDRWSPTNREAYYKNISLVQVTDKSSRFVMDESYLSGQSFSLGYEFIGPGIQKMGLSALTLQANMNDVFRLSTVKIERGISYPFARSVSFSLSATF